MSSERDQIWQTKLRLAHRASRFLRSTVPTIRGIALTGSVAFGDVSDSDDLDFLIITQAHRVYTTRCACYLLAWLLGKKRRPGHEKNAWCLNMFLSETALLIPPPKRTKFAARQISRLRILHDSGGVFDQFRQINQFWTSNSSTTSSKSALNPSTTHHPANCPDLLEKWLYNWQIKYMKKKRTTEITTPDQIFFQPLPRHD